jgi:pilus assembly protein Flp/PilA
MDQLGFQHFRNHLRGDFAETNSSSCSLMRLQPVRGSFPLPTGAKDRRLAEDTDTQESNMKNFVAKFVADESGATAIEYGLIAALIAVAMISGATAIGTAIDTKFQNVAERIGSS